MALRLLPQPAPDPRARGRRARLHAYSRLARVAPRPARRRRVLGRRATGQAALADAVAVVRGLGFATGLHTGGAFPRRLAEVLPHLDWVGIDAKAPQDEYANLTGVATSGIAALASLDLVVASGVTHEVRTTVHPSLTSAAALERLACELAERGITRWVLQPFRVNGCADETLVANAPQGATIERALLAHLRSTCPRSRFAADCATARAGCPRSWRGPLLQPDSPEPRRTVSRRSALPALAPVRPPRTRVVARPRVQVQRVERGHDDAGVPGSVLRRLGEAAGDKVVERRRDAGHERGHARRGRGEDVTQQGRPVLLR